jgi:general secretion pathway protein J
LVELLVSLAIMALILVGLSSGVGFGLRAWHHETAASARADDIETADRSLRLLLGGADPRAPAIGDGADIAWTGMLPAGRGRAALRLSVEDGKRLVLLWRPQPHVTSMEPAQMQAPPQREVLLDGVKAMNIAYYREGASPGWIGAWTGQALPRLVRIQLKPAKGGPDWPALVIATKPSS